MFNDRLNLIMREIQRALQYIQGLLKLEKGKANMERMEEEIPESEYRTYQQFITT